MEEEELMVTVPDDEQGQVHVGGKGRRGVRFLWSRVWLGYAVSLSCGRQGS